MRDGGWRADPALVENWVRGWAITRRVPPPVLEHGAHRVDVGLPEQRRRFVFPAVHSGFAELASRIDEPWVFLKICAPSAEVQHLLPLRWTIQPPAFMMRRPIETAPTQDLPKRYRLACTGALPMIQAAIMTDNESCAASGGAAIVGNHVIFDRIVTHDAHRRQGLGRTLMAALTTLAYQAGARHGVLVATSAGRALYASLGWSLHAHYTSAVILPPR